MVVDVLVDSSCFINLVNGDCLGAVLTLPNHRFWIGTQIQRELMEKVDAQATVDELLLTGRVNLYEPAIGLSEFQFMLDKHGLGAGETEAIILAKRNSWQMGCDDRRARTKAAIEMEQTNITGTLGLLKRCVDQGQLDCDAAWIAYVHMKAKGGYLPKDVTKSYFC